MAESSVEIIYEDDTASRHAHIFEPRTLSKQE